MGTSNYHLAELNIARLKAPLDSPLLKEFVDFLAPVNTFGEQSPGFVWRLVGDDGKSSSYMASPFEDEMIIANLTVWTDIESLRDFIYQTVHSYFLRSRAKWFEKMTGQKLVMWWIPQGYIPTLEEGKAKLEMLEARGPSPEAFTLQHPFDAQGQPVTHTAQRSAEA